MPSLSAAKAANAATKLPYKPVALFIGGTSGIGRSTAAALARYTNGEAHIIICGRNESAAQEALGSFPKSSNPNPAHDREFLACDASLLSNVTAACRTLTSRTMPPPLTKLNYIFITSGYFTLAGRNNTAEGIDRKFCLHFYSRWKFVMELMPLLQAAKDAGEDARFVSVLGAGHGGKIDFEDMGLVKSFSAMKCGLIAPTYNSLMAEEFAQRYPGLSFTHSYPGFVDTGVFSGLHWSLYLVGRLLSTLASSSDDCAEWMIRALLDPAMADGAFQIGRAHV